MHTELMGGQVQDLLQLMGGAEVPTDDPATGLQLLGRSLHSRLAHLEDLRAEAEVSSSEGLHC